MAQFEALALVHHPRELVFATTRDAIVRAVAYDDDIESIVEDGRYERAPLIVEVTNTWRGKMPIPRILGDFIAPHMLLWTDHSVWTGDDHVCRWRISSHYFPHHLRCMGATRFENTSGAKATRVALTGTIHVDPKGASSLPSFAAEKLARGIEEFVCAMFPSSLRKVMDGVSRVIDEDRARAR